MRICNACILPNHGHCVSWPEQDGNWAAFRQRLTVNHVTRLAEAAAPGRGSAAIAGLNHLDVESRDRLVGSAGGCLREGGGFYCHFADAGVGEDSVVGCAFRG